MPDLEISKGQLQPAAELPRRRLNSRSGAPRAAFVSQLIADRYSLVAERQRPLQDALRSYDAGTRIAVRRVPAGYRMTLDA